MLTSRFNRPILRACMLLSTLAGGVVTPALAQPADRIGAINRAITVAQTANPGTWFLAAELEPEDGTWIVDVKSAPPGGGTLFRTEIDAFNFNVRRVRTDSESASKASKNAAEIAAHAAAAVTLEQAMQTATAASPSGAVISEVELELQNSPPGLFYEVRMLVSGVASVLRVDARSGDVAGGGGGGNGDNGNGGGSGGGSGGTPPVAGPIDSLADAIDAVPLISPDGLIKESRFEVKKGVATYKLEVIRPDNTIVEYTLNPAGTVIKTSRKPVSSRTASEVAFIRANIGNASITLSRAITAVLDANPGSAALEAKWEREHGRLAAKVKIRQGARVATAVVDAQTGFLTGGLRPMPPLSTVVDISGAIAAAVGAVPGTTPMKLELEREISGPVYKVQVVNTVTLSSWIVWLDGNSGAVYWIRPDPLNVGERRKFAARVAQLGQLSGTFQQAADLTLPNPNPNGTVVREIEIGFQRGVIGYEVDLVTGKTRSKFFVNGMTGAVTRRK